MKPLGESGGITVQALFCYIVLRSYLVLLTITSIRLELQNTTNKAIQLQTHPNIDKELFKTRSVIGLKNPAKPFPVNTGVGVLKWR